jgi:DNA-binding GntR family transcriptional regulator
MTLRSAVLAVFDWSGRPPVYLQLADRLAAVITDGDIAPGALFDSEPRMASQLALSIPTVNRAVTILIDRGLVIRQRGTGTRVLPAASPAAPSATHQLRNSYVSQPSSAVEIVEGHAS